MMEWCFANEPKLAEIIARCWRFQGAEESVKECSKTRLDLLEDAARSPCSCGGRWKPAARQLFECNGLDETEWCEAVLRSFREGRSKGTVVTHVGIQGNEGKSFLFKPLSAVLGHDKIFTPAKGAFPLLHLEDCRAVLLDDWRWNEDVQSIATRQQTCHQRC